MKIFLIGYRCTGKTTIGKRLSDRLGYKFIDTDLMIEQQIKSTITKFVTSHGWDKFRQIEKLTLFKTKKFENTIISTGGGIVADPENQAFIRSNGYSIWLDADLKTILSRLACDKKTDSNRPSLTLKTVLEETKEMIQKRKPLYKNTANTRIDTSIHTIDEIINIIDRRLTDVW